ncbi:hypothetical protein A4A49_52184 [Nicotiana attenuata]|uniref:DUF4283 domain-containing protein n=1 Tax=Nicotiana attenuata TaxID=49451 RepID=A0A1J6IC27_NICAT|nr:hypothetical protein A4A49_52184 [Nicotiana attenuata]
MAKGQPERYRTRHRLRLADVADEIVTVIAMHVATAQLEQSRILKAQAEMERLVATAPPAGKLTSPLVLAVNPQKFELTKQPPPPMEEKKTWVNLFTGNRLAPKGINMQLIAPVIKNGVKMVQFDKAEIEKEFETWKYALILYVVRDSPTIGAVTRFLGSQWTFQHKPHIYFHNDDCFVIRFYGCGDRDGVMMSTPYMLNSKPVIVKPWSAKFNFSEEIFKTIPLRALLYVRMNAPLKSKDVPIPPILEVPSEEIEGVPENEKDGWTTVKGKAAARPQVIGKSSQYLVDDENGFNPMRGTSFQQVLQVASGKESLLTPTTITNDYCYLEC